MAVGTWPPPSWTDDERVTVAIMLARVSGPFTDMESHAHSGAAGDGSAALTPNTVLFTDQADEDAPASGKTILWTNSGKLHQRTNGGSAEEFDVVGHTHTLQQISEAADHGQDTESENDFGPTTSLAVSDTYEDTGMAVTMTPASAKNAVVSAYGAVFTNATPVGVEANATYNLRLLAGGVQKEELSITIQSDDGSDFWYEACRGAFTNIDGAASSTIFKTQWKIHDNSGSHSHLIQDKSTYLHVVEVSV